MNDVALKDSRPTHPMVAFKRDLEMMVERELDMLDDKSRQRMRSAAIVAVTKDPELLMADRQSFMMAIRMCASHGVLPDGNEAVLQVYNTKAKDHAGKEIWVKKVTYLPMIRGIINRVQRSGKVKMFYAEVVHGEETFRIDTTHGDRRPVHDFDPMRRTGDIIGAYSVAVWHDGVVDTEPMPRSEIDKVRAVAKTKNVWDGWFSEKAKVAVMKRHAKRLPLSAEDMDFILNRDETDFDQAPVEPKPITPLQQKIAAARGEVLPPEPEPEGLTYDVEDAQELPADEAHWTESVEAGSFPGSAEWTEGAKAFQAGMKRTMCPHQDDAEKAADWLGGFDGARRAVA